MKTEPTFSLRSRLFLSLSLSLSYSVTITVLCMKPLSSIVLSYCNSCNILLYFSSFVEYISHSHQ